MKLLRSIPAFIFALVSIQFLIVCAQQHLDVSVVTKTISLANKDDVVKIRVTDSAGHAVTKPKVVLLKAYPTNSEETVLVTNQELSPVPSDPTLFQFNLLAAKPEAGSYTLELKVTPGDKKHTAVDNVAVNVKVVGLVTISETQVTVSDSEDTQDMSAGRKYKVEFGKKIDTPIKVEHFQHLWVEFKVKGQSGKNVQVQQAFVRIGDGKGREVILPAKFSTKGYTAHVFARDVANEFYGQSGNYELQLIVGDAFVSNPTAWALGTVSFNFANSSRVEPPADPFAVLPEIHHVFRLPDKRPPKTISMAFTLVTLGVPFLVLFVGLVAVGANLKNFPTGANFIYAVGFQASLGAILALFAIYWLRLDMMQTLGYLTVLFVPFLFFAHKNLNSLSKLKQHAE